MSITNKKNRFEEGKQGVLMPVFPQSSRIVLSIFLNLRSWLVMLMQEKKESKSNGGRRTHQILRAITIASEAQDKDMNRH